MAMNYMRKSAAIKKFAPLKESGKTLDEIKSAIEEEMQNDKPKYSADEVTEILEGIMKPADDKADDKADNEVKNDKPATSVIPAPSNAIPQNRSGNLRTVYKYKVKPKYKTMRIEGQSKQVLTGYDREGDCLQITTLETRHIDALNAQTPNSMQFYFDDQETIFLDIEKWD